MRGDEAVREYTVKFDRRCPEAFEVGREIINDALTAADPAKFADGTGREEYMHDLINCAMSTGNLVAITTCFTHGAFGNGVKYEK